MKYRPILVAAAAIGVLAILLAFTSFGGSVKSAPLMVTPGAALGNPATVVVYTATPGN